MVKQRKFTGEFKARVVLEILTEQKCAAQASWEFGTTTPRPLHFEKVPHLQKTVPEIN
jgi:transposase-like protein